MESSIKEIAIETEENGVIVQYSVKENGVVPFLYAIDRHGQRSNRFVYLVSGPHEYSMWLVVDPLNKYDTWYEHTSHIISVVAPSES